MIIAVALSKYCDLIPMNRYAAMAGRSGLIDLPPHSLIDSTHNFAEFVMGDYQKIKDKVFSNRVLMPMKLLTGCWRETRQKRGNCGDFPLVRPVILNVMIRDQEM